MKTLFVTTREAWLAGHQAGHFHPVGGSHWLDIGDGLILLAATFNGEYGEETFSAHPDVAPLPDPVFQGTVKLKDHVEKGGKFTARHHAALTAKFGVTDADTVMDVSAKAKAVCKSVCVAHIY